MHTHYFVYLLNILITPASSTHPLFNHFYVLMLGPQATAHVLRRVFERWGLGHGLRRRMRNDARGGALRLTNLSFRCNAVSKRCDRRLNSRLSITEHLARYGLFLYSRSESKPTLR